MARTKQGNLIAGFKRSLSTILSTIPPGEEYHAELTSLREKMEKAFPALTDLGSEIESVPCLALQTYTYLLASVMYDKNCLNTLSFEDTQLVRRAIKTLELRYHLNSQGQDEPNYVDTVVLKIFGHLIVLLTNYDNKHSGSDDYECIMKIKYVLDLFNRAFPHIDQFSTAQFNNIIQDEDTVRLYIIAKISLAELILRSDRACRERLGDLANLRAIKKLLDQQLLQRLSPTKHLKTEQKVFIKKLLKKCDAQIDAQLAALSKTLASNDTLLKHKSACDFIRQYQQEFGEIATLDSQHQEITEMYWGTHMALLESAYERNDLEQLTTIYYHILRRFQGYPELSKSWIQETEQEINDKMSELRPNITMADLDAAYTLSTIPELEASRKRERASDPTEVKASLGAKRYGFARNIQASTTLTGPVPSDPKRAKVEDSISKGIK